MNTRRRCARIAGYLAHLGVRLDAAANQTGAAGISAPDSAVALRVVRVDEGRALAAEAAALPRAD